MWAMATRRRDAPPEDPFAAIGCIDVVPIGAGGSSLVYRARQEAFDRLIALKVLSLPLTDERSRRRFERELALAGRLTGHPNVVTVFASGFFGDGRAYVEMEYCPGGSLADRLAAQGPLPVRDVVSIGVKIAGVLELARVAGIVHRDVKPANVLVTRFGEPALADFGIAIVAGEMTGTTQALTPVHAAPEVLESRGAGPPADQWSLASTLHTLLAGRAPFASSSEDEGLLSGMLRILNDPVPVIPRPDVPETLRSVLARAMTKDPLGRWASAGDLGAALQEVERGEGWPVTIMPIEEVPEARYPPISAGDPAGVEGRDGAALEPGSTRSLPGGPLAPAARDGSIWPQPAPPAAPAPPSGASFPPPSGAPLAPPSGAPLAPPEGQAGAPDGDTVRWARRAGPHVPVEPPAHGSAGPDGPGGAGPGLAGPGPAVAAGPGGAGPGPSGSQVPFVAPDVAPGESTQYWTRARRTPIDDLPPMPEEQRRHTKLWAAAAGALVVVVALVVALLVTRSPAHPQITKNTVTPPSNPQPKQYQPVNLAVASESGTTVTLRWKDPSNGLYPYVVQVVGTPSVHATNTSTQTVIASLDPTKGYCFVPSARSTPSGHPRRTLPRCASGGGRLPPPPRRRRCRRPRSRAEWGGSSGGPGRGPSRSGLRADRGTLRVEIPRSGGYPPREPAVGSTPGVRSRGPSTGKRTRSPAPQPRRRGPPVAR